MLKIEYKKVAYLLEYKISLKYKNFIVFFLSLFILIDSFEF